MTEAGLYYLAVGCVHLHVCGCCSIVVLYLWYLTTECSPQTLNVDGCEKVTVKGLTHMMTGRKFVERSPDFFGYVPVPVCARKHFGAIAT